ncbi:MAG: hypothetical protein HOM34_07235 [Planctomycetes bacterium]|jgi:hypothetical protein|nr:hypothetical protein [Planctomycetota bacterium]MBT4028684.1 hypothetical protein [Planctomycetota bacterium]MBT4560102.1 hypothetical protein [Planctomycetota bacterium]MBT5102250.1 hypothetical protein [Planctomycetota bacterium]MBT5120496.1 hypothetical protein [Planctomycetota bacterium]
MKRITTLLSLFATIILLGSCAGVQVSDDTFSAHAEALVILGFELPGDEALAAEALVPEGAIVQTVYSSPDDWTSLLGVLNNILGVHYTIIGGSLK